jgi:hypothetical protein
LFVEAWLLRSLNKTVESWFDSAVI